MSRCRQCGQPIYWWVTARGRYQPRDADGEVHFARCPARPPSAHPPDVCIACGSLAVQHEPGVGPHRARLRCHDCGAQRWLPKLRAVATVAGGTD